MQRKWMMIVDERSWIHKVEFLSGFTVIECQKTRIVVITVICYIALQDIFRFGL